MDILTCFRLAHALGRDVDEVMLWPYEKIRQWLAFFEIKRREAKTDESA